MNCPMQNEDMQFLISFFRRQEINRKGRRRALTQGISWVGQWNPPHSQIRWLLLNLLLDLG